MDPATTASLAFGTTTVLAAGVAFVLLIVAVALLLHRRTLQARLDQEAETVQQLQRDIERLRPFAEVADAAAEASRLRRQASAEAEQRAANARTEASAILTAAQAEALRMLGDAAREVEAAQAEAMELRATARSYRREQKEQADGVLSASSHNAARIIEEARDEARRIAGDALHAMENAHRWEATERAMRNVIEGYGDAYMKPPHSVLDDLADDYSHKEAGRELRMARERSILMATQGRAANCDYVEANRRQTAIRFVTDAFNGKVDAILSTARSSNVGTLTQMIVDAYAMVNHNGAAFRNARITQEYLNARLVELKWATAVLLLRDQEREDERAIKARLREEERAQREFERAQREAAKDQAMLRKAMEKAEEKLRNAREEDRTRFEAQLAELRVRLSEAEERNQRAVSMAQLTRSGFVYIISNFGSFGENMLKIGLTRRLEPLDRVRELGDASVPFRFDVHALIYSEDAPRLETALHHRFALTQVNKVNPRKEFFNVSLADVRAVVEELGVDVHWTMKAEALEYRETLALNDVLATDATLREAWLARQARWDAYLEALGDEADEGGDDDSDVGLPPAALLAEA